MLNSLEDTNRHFSDEQRKQIEEHRAKWRAVNYGETDTNIAKYNRQVDSYGRIRYW